MRFSIVTPSFRSSQWLPLCIASVADQGLDTEHIVQDAVSDDGTPEWLVRDARVKAFIEKDNGMYDAINRGLRRATGDILAYLNCDEQYLPGALAKVQAHFQQHPETEVVCGDMVVINGQGEYQCHRKAHWPGKYHTLVSGTLGIMSCAIFFRRSLIEDRKLFFNTELRDLGDVEWIWRLRKQKVALGLLRSFTSAFTLTGKNMNQMPNAQRERQLLFASAPAWARYGRSLIVLNFRLRGLLAGRYHQPPFTYSIYTKQNAKARTTFAVRQPTHRWPPAA